MGSKTAHDPEPEHDDEFPIHEYDSEGRLWCNGNLISDPLSHPPVRMES